MWTTSKISISGDLRVLWWCQLRITWKNGQYWPNTVFYVKLTTHNWKKRVSGLQSTILKSAIISSFAKNKNSFYYMKVLIHYNRSLPSHVLSSRLKYLKLRFNFYRVLGVLSNINRIDYMQKTRDAEITWTRRNVVGRRRLLLSGVDTDGESGKSKGPFNNNKKFVYK
jgi:hypothetical protein